MCLCLFAAQKPYLSVEEMLKVVQETGHVWTAVRSHSGSSHASLPAQAIRFGIRFGSVRLMAWCIGAFRGTQARTHTHKQARTCMHDAHAHARTCARTHTSKCARAQKQDHQAHDAGRTCTHLLLRFCVPSKSRRFVAVERKGPLEHSTGQWLCRIRGGRSRRLN